MLSFYFGVLCLLLMYVGSLIGVDLSTPEILEALQVTAKSADNKPPRSDSTRAKKDNRVILAELNCRKENEAHQLG